MLRFTVYTSQYNPITVQADNDHWNVLTPSSHNLIARLVNGDYAVLKESDAAGGVIVNEADGQMIRVTDIDTTAKSLKIAEVKTQKTGSVRRRFARGRF